jgi:hypothetical protein
VATNGHWAANIPQGCRHIKINTNHAYVLGGFAYVEDAASTMTVAVTLQISFPDDIQYTVRYYRKELASFVEIGNVASGTTNSMKTGSISGTPKLPDAATDIIIQNYAVPTKGERTSVKVKFTTPAAVSTTEINFQVHNDFAPSHPLYAPANTAGNVLCYTNLDGKVMKTMHSNCKFNNVGGASDPNTYAMTLTAPIAAASTVWVTITTLNANVLSMPTTFNPNYATFTVVTDGPSTINDPVLYRVPPAHFKTLIIE